MKHIFIFLFILSNSINIFAQNHHDRFESIDVIQYIFEIHLNDSTNLIEGNASVIFKKLKPIESIILDLASVDSTGNGMHVKSVKVQDYANFSHENNLLVIDYVADTTGSSDIGEVSIEYSGIPADGLIISKNKYGDRTFFGDNWPDRAKHWLPTVDHPSDKAPVIFSIVAPDHYDVISNGKLDEIIRFNNGYKKTVWRENTPISTKLMVIGVAGFAVGNKKTYKDIPVSSWVFPQNKEQAFKNYQFGTEALQYFTELIGRYSYEKLVHVQSKTRYGGMENASCIFYSERTGTSNSSQERLFAHEVAHQWFGNSVTEQNWHHVWLSEGFATYLTHVYNQNFHGEELFKDGLKRDRERVIKYSYRKLAPIIDTTVTEYIRLLNANSYQKASWFLHMLRMDLGDEIFFSGLQKYYSKFQNSTALTKDFQTVMEAVSDKKLDKFFQQWLWQAGHPVLDYEWSKKNNQIQIKITQTQSDYLYKFPIEIKFFYKDLNPEIRKFRVYERETTILIPEKNIVKMIHLDPNVNLLFEYDFERK